jgi:hypothetical protein
MLRQAMLRQAMLRQAMLCQALLRQALLLPALAFKIRLSARNPPRRFHHPLQEPSSFLQHRQRRSL